MQVKEVDGLWREWREAEDFANATPYSYHFVVEREENNNGSVKVRFGDGTNGAIPPVGSGNVRRIHATEDFGSLCWIGRNERVAASIVPII